MGSTSTPCAGQTALFYSLDWDDQQAAKEVCAGCLLRPRCLQRALEVGGFDRWADGIQGGFDPEERGFYRRLYGTDVQRVRELPARFRTRPPASRSGAA